MKHQDWTVINVGRQSGSSLTKHELLLKEQQARRNGDGVSYKKAFVNNNSYKPPDNSRKLADATESSKIETLKCGVDIMQARTKLNMKRKALATLINKKEEVVAQFENNQALATPENKKILNQIKRKLSIK